MRYSEQYGRSNGIERNLTPKEISGELSIGTAESAGGMREPSVQIAKGMDVSLFGHFFFRRAAISVSLSRTR